MTVPENVRDGDPYDDPAFEELARAHDVWGRASGALCAVFWRAGKEAQAREIEALKKQVHDLNWALGTDGYDKMHDPQDQAEHEQAVRGTERFVERMRLAAEKHEALQADAEQYRWLRAQHWNDGTLAVLRSADLPLGVQTFSGQLLDDAITVRRMAAPVPEAGGLEK